MKPTARKKGKSRVFLIEPAADVRGPLARLIGAEPDLSVCGEAADMEAAVEALPAAAPDVIVVDVDAFNADLVAALNRLRWVNPGVPVIAISIWELAVRGRRMLQAGVSGYVAKPEAAVQIVPALRAVLKGGVYPDLGRRNQRGGKS